MEKARLLFLFHIVLAVQGQKEGDVRLLENGGATFEGVLQVYTQDKWNIVCNNQGYTNDDEAAAAACRTLGYATYLKWGSAKTLGFNIDSNGNNYQPTAINGIRCPNVINLVTEAELFLMRCDVGQVINSTTCDPQTIVGIKCDTSIKNYYNGQVRILSQYDSNHVQNVAPLLEIYLEDNWRPVCVNSSNVNQGFADSACRQMGYTGAQSYRPYVPKIHQISWKIEIVPICSAAENVRISYPCLTDCMNYSTYTSLDGCDGHEKSVLLTCKFSKPDQVFWSSGNQFICPVAMNTGHTDLESSPVTAGLSVAVAILTIGLVITLTLLLRLCCCRLRIDNKEGSLLYTKIKWRQFFCCQFGNQQQDGQPGDGKNGQLPRAPGGGQGETDELLEKK